MLGDKIRIGKYRKRTGYRRHNGFRAKLSQVQIEGITTRSADPRQTAKEKSSAAAKPKAAAPKRTSAATRKPAAKKNAD